MTSHPAIWRATVLTLFPEMFPGPLGISLAGKALSSGVWALEVRDIRDSATDRHRSVDDTPAGGGPGMVLRADILAAAIDAAELAPDAPKHRPRLLMSPRGRPLTQPRIIELAAGPSPLIVCGRFEGVDQRVIETRELEEVSVGDYVLSGGEIAAMAVIDACVRLLPGVPAIYPPADFRGPPNSGNPDLGRSCPGRGLAESRGRSPDPAAAAGPLGAEDRSEGCQMSPKSKTEG
jgi:tRNA (guanine37-N1)-methyltransferase